MHIPCFFSLQQAPILLRFNLMKHGGKKFANVKITIHLKFQTDILIYFYIFKCLIC